MQFWQCVVRMMMYSFRIRRRVLPIGDVHGLLLVVCIIEIIVTGY